MRIAAGKPLGSITQSAIPFLATLLVRCLPGHSARRPAALPFDQSVIAVHTYPAFYKLGELGKPLRPTGALHLIWHTYLSVMAQEQLRG